MILILRSIELFRYWVDAESPINIYKQPWTEYRNDVEQMTSIHPKKKQRPCTFAVSRPEIHSDPTMRLNGQTQLEVDLKDVDQTVQPIYTPWITKIDKNIDTTC
jgi:hypothetical protein